MRSRANITAPSIIRLLSTIIYDNIIIIIVVIVPAGKVFVLCRRLITREFSRRLLRINISML